MKPVWRLTVLEWIVLIASLALLAWMFFNAHSEVPHKRAGKRARNSDPAATTTGTRPSLASIASR